MIDKIKENIQVGFGKKETAKTPTMIASDIRSINELLEAADKYVAAFFGSNSAKDVKEAAQGLERTNSRMNAKYGKLLLEQ